jgi:hypothetical protein
MKTTTYLRVSTLLTASGVLFAGYLSAHRALLGVCAFDESCPFFLGHPACYTGFSLFLTLFVVSSVGLARRTEAVWPMVATLCVSSFGVVFAASMTARELGAHVHYKMGLPTCAYGLVFFAAVLGVSIAALGSQWQATHPGGTLNARGT